MDNGQSNLTNACGSLRKQRRNTFIKFKMKNEDEWQKAKVLNYQPKQTGKYKNWVNVKSDFDVEPKCVHWDDNESCNTRQQSWDTLHFLYSATNCHPPLLLKECWVSGEVPAIMEKFRMHANFKCPASKPTLF